VLLLDPGHSNRAAPLASQESGCYHIPKYIFGVMGIWSVAMVITRPLNHILRSWTHIAVLRALRDTATGFSGNRVARASGMTPRSAFHALSALETLGLVKRQRGGREHLFSLNRANLFVQHGLLPLLQIERELPDRLGRDLASILHKKVVVAVIFGSAARGEAVPDSDLDLCCVVRNEQQKDAVRSALERASATLQHVYGVRVAPLYFSVEEFRRKRTSRLVKQILDDGQLVAGTALKAVLRG
jgi:predicted nucleotidyltransferase